MKAKVYIAILLILLVLVFIYYKYKKRMALNSEFLNGLSTDQKNNIGLIVSDLKDRGITNKKLQAGILSVVYKESGLIPKRENLNYTTEGMLRVWPSIFKTANDTLPYLKQPQKLANKVYTRFGNTSFNDGWNYRGGGFNQLTFKDQYKSFGKAIGVDLVNKPDLINTPEIASKVNASYFNGKIKIVFPKINIDEIPDLDTALKIAYDANAGKFNKWQADTTGGYKKAQSVIQDFYNYINQ